NHASTLTPSFILATATVYVSWFAKLVGRTTMCVKVSISPSPCKSTHSTAELRQREQSATGGKVILPHLVHFEAYTFPFGRPLQNSMSLSVGSSKMKVTGLDFSFCAGGPRDIFSIPKNRHIAIMTRAANIVRECQTVLDRHLNSSSLFPKLACHPHYH